MLILCYLLVMVGLALGSAMAVRSLSEQQAAQRYATQAHAFQLAESGIDDAISRLRIGTNWVTLTGPLTTTLSDASTYVMQITQEGALRRIHSTGTPSGSTISKRLEALVRRAIPPNFYTNAIDTADTVVLRGSSYHVLGNILTGDTDPIQNTGHVQGLILQDPSAQPLPKLDFAQLYAIAHRQGNVYDADRLHDVQHGFDAFPHSFCVNPLADADPLLTCEPNVNFITTDLVLKGSIGTIGGFFVVVGSVLTDPSAVEDTTINGAGQVKGAIYTTGEFRVNGGGNGLNIDGGVWAGDEARLNGNVTVQYNAAYMAAIQHLNINPDVQLLLWRACPPSGCS